MSRLEARGSLAIEGNQVGGEGIQDESKGVQSGSKESRQEGRVRAQV